MPKIGGDSRNRILDVAFGHFSDKGFDECSMRDIANAAGIKAASLYNHFAGKRDLFESLIEREASYVEEQLRRSGAMASPDDDSAAYMEQEEGSITDLIWRSYAPFFEDDRVKKLMHLLAASRYKDERCGNLYKGIFIERPLAIQQAIFDRLVSLGKFSACDTLLAAGQFHGPMLMLMEAEAEPRDAKEFCHAHTLSFNACHREWSC